MKIESQNSKNTRALKSGFKEIKSTGEPFGGTINTEYYHLLIYEIWEYNKFGPAGYT